MKGLLIILGCYTGGMVLHRYGHVPLPGSVIGMLLLTLALVRGWIRLEWVERASAFLLKHILLFFVPIIVTSLALYGHVFVEQGALVTAALVLGPAIVMLAAGVVAERLLPQAKAATGEAAPDTASPPAATGVDPASAAPPAAASATAPVSMEQGREHHG